MPITPRNDSGASNPRIVALAGPMEGQVFQVGSEPFSIGRHSPNQLRLRHESVSRSHCILQREAEGFVLRDLGSSNGTFVNGVPIGERRLEHGDLIQVGDSLLLLLFDSAEPDETAASFGLHAGGESLPATAEMPVGETLYLQSDKVLRSLEPGARTARHLNALFRISTVIHSERGVQAIARRLMELVFEVVPAERVAVALTDGDELSSVHAADRRTGRAEPPSQLSRALVQRVLKEGLAVMSCDVSHGEDPGGAPSRSFLCVPLVTRERPLGVLYADTREKAVFEEEHLHLLSAVAGIAAVVLGDARRMEWLEAENRRFREAELDHEMVGESPVMKKLYELIARVAPTDYSVLIQGESGTGKELVAKALHRNCPRAEGPFVAINCATLSETLLESELFGHEKGAFTGAVGRKVGKLELADQGTVFLDEVGEIPAALQAKLLRALESQEFERVGGTRRIRVDVRVVAATNRDIEAALRDGTFRRDLYHRLKVFNLSIAPLRERREDIPLLAQHFAARASRRLNRPLAGISRRARSCLLAYDWPGNVRELQNAIQRAMVLAARDVIGAEDLPEEVHESSGATSPASTYHEKLFEAKKRIVTEALEKAEGNYSATARNLGLNRTYLHRLMRNLKLQPGP